MAQGAFATRARRPREPRPVIWDLRQATCLVTGDALWSLHGTHELANSGKEDHGSSRKRADGPAGALARLHADADVDRLVNLASRRG